jgi:hypothetical protein
MADQLLSEAGEFVLEGEYHLDQDRCIATAIARLEHLEESIAYYRRERQDLIEAQFEKEGELYWMTEELERLRPYWLPGMTKKEAVAHYLEAKRRDIGQEGTNGSQELTVEGLIAALQKAKDLAGAGASVRMVDDEPVVSVSVRCGVVYVSDIRQGDESELA